MSRPVVRVLLDSPLPQLDRLFDYAVPDGMEMPPVGARVRVPLRSAGRMIEAYVIEQGFEEDAERALSEVERLVSAVPVLPSELYALIRRAADRAAGSAADIVRVAVPRRQARVEKAWTGTAPEVHLDPGALQRAGEIVADYPELTSLFFSDTDAAGDVGADSGSPIFLRAVVEAIPLVSGTIPASMWLLAAAATLTLANGRSAILVVPDHRDLQRLCAALEHLVPTHAVARWDAGQPNSDRYRAYLRALSAEPCIVVGNRSSVYAPVRAGLLAIWDDGDPLYVEPLSPGVHARDAALLRQEQENSSLLLVAHARSTDAERLVQAGWFSDVRAQRRSRPAVQLSTPEELERRGSRVPSRAFRAAREAVQAGPVLVQVARPGFAPSLVCQTCRAPARCTSCRGALEAPARQATARCRWCGREAHRWHCSECGSARMRLASSGSERTAEELGRAFPGTRVIIADGAHPVLHVGAEPALVVATRGAEPVAEDGYAAVILLDGAQMLQAPDLRIGESCVRWWVNAAALAAPGAPIHLVGVDGPAARAVATWTLPAYAQAELGERVPLLLPPTVRVAQIDGTAPAVDEVLQALTALPLPPLAILGPIGTDSDRVRALVRFPYALGAAVTETLRSSVVRHAALGRREKTAPGARGRARVALTVRLDVLDPELEAAPEHSAPVR